MSNRKVSTMSKLSPFFPFFCREVWPPLAQDLQYGAPNSNGLSSCSINCYPFNSNFGVSLCDFYHSFPSLRIKITQLSPLYPYDWIAISPLYTSFLNMCKTAKFQHPGGEGCVDDLPHPAQHHGPHPEVQGLHRGIARTADPEQFWRNDIVCVVKITNVLKKKHVKLCKEWREK